MSQDKPPRQNLKGTLPLGQKSPPLPPYGEVERVPSRDGKTAIPVLSAVAEAPQPIGPAAPPAPPGRKIPPGMEALLRTQVMPPTTPWAPSQDEHTAPLAPAPAASPAVPAAAVPSLDAKQLAEMDARGDDAVAKAEAKLKEVEASAPPAPPVAPDAHPPTPAELQEMQSLAGELEHAYGQMSEAVSRLSDLVSRLPG